MLSWYISIIIIISSKSLSLIYIHIYVPSNNEGHIRLIIADKIIFTFDNNCITTYYVHAITMDIVIIMSIDQ
jgi:hypothetical protein